MMGRRSTFKRRPQDKYATPASAVLPLLPHLPTIAHFVEPCAGNGALIRHLKEHGHRCVYRSDINPKRAGIHTRDALTLNANWRERADLRAAGRLLFITNPPWTMQIKCALIEHLPKLLPTWLLMDADFMHTRAAGALLDRCDKIVSVGRVKWIPNSEFVGKDNAAWFRFVHRHQGGPQFYGREIA